MDALRDGLHLPQGSPCPPFAAECLCTCVPPCAQIYEVKLDKVPSEADLERLRRGVVITTAVQRDRVTRDVTAKTLPCGIRRLGGRASPRIEFTLTEGRNRQIRRMCEALGYTVVDLHRVSFAGISIKGLRPNTWAQLEDDELAIIQNALTDYHAD